MTSFRSRFPLPFPLLLALAFLSVAGCGSRLSRVDSRDYLTDGGTCEEMILLDGKQIGVQKTVFEPLSGQNDGAVLAITLNSRLDDEDGPLQIIRVVSRYGPEDRFLGAEGTIWNRQGDQTTTVSTPEDARDGPAALTLSLLREPLRLGDRRDVTTYDMFTRQETSFHLVGREQVRLEGNTILAVDMDLRFGAQHQTGRMYCDGAGNILRSDLVVYRGNVERRADKDGKPLPAPVVETVEKTMTIQRAERN